MNWILLLLVLITLLAITGFLVIRRRHQSVHAKAVILEKNLEAEIEQRYVLASIIAHDIRTPLHYVSYTANYMQEQHSSLSPADIRETAAAIEQSTRKISSFAETFINWLQSQHSCYAIHHEKIEVKKLIGELDHFSSEFRKLGNNAIFFTWDEEAMAGLYSDYYGLKIILRNLLDNAIKYTQHGEIHLNGSRSGNEVCFEVRDNGRGISEEEIANIRALMAIQDERFGLHHSRKMGMQIICGFLRKMNGRFEAERLANGSAFRIYLPLTSPR